VSSRVLVALSSLAFASPALWAQPTAEPATIVITAARVEQALPDALPSTRVISRAEIDALQPADLPALLRALTSIDVAQSGGPGGVTSLFLRGTNSNSTLVLVDGVKLNSPFFGGVDLSSLGTANV